MPVKFLANQNTIIFGQTGAGKTVFMLKVIDQKLIEPFPVNIYWFYGVEQTFMKSYPAIKFVKGLQLDVIDTSSPSLIVLDDLLLDISPEMASAFIMGSHHNQMSLFMITQNLFPNSNLFRTCMLNCHTYILFYNQRQFRQVVTLARQCFVGKDVQRILVAYKRASLKPRDFIMLNFSPLMPKELTVVGDYFSICPSVYL